MNFLVVMMRGGDIGCLVIDELRLCYLAEPSLLEELSLIPFGHSQIYADYTIFRTWGDRFEFQYTVFLQHDGTREEMGTLKFGRYGGKDDLYVFYKVCNHCLYNAALLQDTLNFPELLGMQFNNFTAIDIALDHRKNFSSIIKRLMRNPKIKTILNGKAFNDRKGLIKGLSFNFSSSLSRLHCPTVTFSQVKAIKNKEKGITVQSYDKKAEIELNSEKQYILNFHHNPRYLFRLEVRLHYQELKDFFRKIGQAQSINNLFDPSILQKLFFYHLSSVLRFTKGRKPLSWQEIISCNGRV